MCFQLTSETEWTLHKLVFDCLIRIVILFYILPHIKKSAHWLIKAKD